MADDPYPFLAKTPSRNQSAATRGAVWFYVIAGRSLINSILNVAHAGIQFLFGLGITQLVDMFVPRMAPNLQCAWCSMWRMP
jgi:hypothetical protein